MLSVLLSWFVSKRAVLSSRGGGWSNKNSEKLFHLNLQRGGKTGYRIWPFCCSLWYLICFTSDFRAIRKLQPTSLLKPQTQVCKSICTILSIYILCSALDYWNSSVQWHWIDTVPNLTAMDPEWYYRTFMKKSILPVQTAIPGTKHRGFIIVSVICIRTVADKRKMLIFIDFLIC